jgi:hypothetical protein
VQLVIKLYPKPTSHIKKMDVAGGISTCDGVTTNTPVLREDQEFNLLQMQVCGFSTIKNEIYRKKGIRKRGVKHEKRLTSVSLLPSLSR